MKCLIPTLFIMPILSVANAESGAPLVVACVGDSITYGHGASNRAATSYPAQLQAMLGDGWKVLNFGHNARTALDDGKELGGKSGMGYRQSPEFRKALECSPDVVLFMLGTNDSKPINWDGRADDVKRDYESLVADFRALDSNPLVVVGISPFVKKDSFTIRESVVGGELAPWQRGFARSARLPAVDVYEATKAAADTAFTGDGVHPNDSGYGVIAAAFAGKLRELALPLAGRRAARDRKAPRFEFGADGSFAVLHVTDVQDRAKLAARSAAVLRAALSSTRPDLVVLTGDNVDSGSNARSAFVGAMEPLVAIFEEFRTHFCVTFGNHDSERKGEGFLTRQEQYDWLKARGGKFFVDHDVAPLSGVGSGAVEIALPGAARPSFRLFVMDSGDYASGGYDGCHADQIAWYELASGDGIPHLWFQHIIVPDANDTGLFRAATEGEAGPEMPIRGERVRAVPASGVLGAINEPTCPPKWPAYRDREHTVDGRTLYDAWRANGHMVGAYFGHDHKNSFDGVDMNGIRMGATKALTLNSYNDGDPGLRLFVIHPDGTFETEHATESHPFPVNGDGAAYRPPAPQQLPRAAP